MAYNTTSFDRSYMTKSALESQDVLVSKTKSFMTIHWVIMAQQLNLSKISKYWDSTVYAYIKVIFMFNYGITKLYSNE